MNEHQQTKLQYLLILVGLIIAVALGISTRGNPSGSRGKEKALAGGPAEAQILTGTSKGFGGDVTVTLKADENQIYSVVAEGPGETPEVGGKALAPQAEKIVAQQSVAVDATSGATVTSTAISNAAAEALKAGGLDAAKFGADKLQAAAAEAPAPAAAAPAAAAPAPAAAAPAEAPKAEAPEKPADAKTLTAVEKGFGGDVTVTLVADENGIYSVEAEGADETPTVGGMAFDPLESRILEAQSLDIDGISGATVTSTAVLAAAKAALDGAGIDPAGFKKDGAAEAEAPEEPDSYEADIVIVGAGGAGMTAAITATKNGQKVILVESQAMVGGNSSRATGGINAAKTVIQDENEFAEDAAVEKVLATAAAKWADNETITALAATVQEQWDAYKAAPEGYFDSVELFELDTMIGGKGINDPELVKTLCENSENAVYWLDSIGAPVPSVGQFGGASVKRIHRPVDADGKTIAVGNYIVGVLKQNLDDLGIEVLYETTAEKILLDEEGKAVGIEAKAGDRTITVNTKAVVLTTGGFGANLDMVAEKKPDLKGFMTTNAAGAQGQGIIMAQEAGAAVVDLDQIQIHPTVEANTAKLITEGLRGDGAILVNSEGKRFVDETGTRDVVSAAEIAQPGSFSWLIVDQAMADASSVIGGYIKNGLTIQGEDYAALAKALEIDPAILEATMADYQAAVDEKRDREYGRLSFNQRLDQAPFYAIKVTAGIHHTMGGVKIDSKTQVLKEDGSVIPGLFAAGEVTGGVHGANRLGGNAVADFTVFGRIAGNSATEYTGGTVAADDFAAPAPSEEAPEENAVPETAKTLTAVEKGFGGDVTVTLVADENGIYSVEAEGADETPTVGGMAFEPLAAKILSEQSVDVDAISGATLTSNAVLTAAKTALDEAGIDPAGFSASAGGAAEDETREADIVIVGAGGAGMTAAITATKEGKTVLLVESQSIVGGNSSRATGGINAAKTAIQDENEFAEDAAVEKVLATAAEKWADNETITALAATVQEQWDAYKAAPEGYFDSVELFELDTMIGGKGINDPELVKALCENSESAIEWLESVGAPVPNVGQFGGASVKRIHRPVDADGKTIAVGNYIVGVLKQNLDDLGIEVLYDTTAEKILLDEEGKAVGIEASNNGRKITVNAKAVVLTTGGFGANLDMVAEKKPDLKGFMTTNAAGAQGQGIIMAQEAGAAVVDLDQIQIHPTVEANTAKLITEGLRGDGAILVNSEGKRFVDETGTRDVVSAAEIAQPGSFSWLIVDQAMADASSVIGGYIKNGLTIEGADYTALAEALDIDPEALIATMEEYQACVDAKEDKEFGRLSFNQRLDQAPFYAIKVTAGIHHTMGGVKIDPETQVLKEDGSVIPGLFAAGEVTGGVHGANRLGGNAVADFTVFGKIAGEKASEYAGE